MASWAQGTVQGPAGLAKTKSEKSTRAFCDNRYQEKYLQCEENFAIPQLNPYLKTLVSSFIDASSLLIGPITEQSSMAIFKYLQVEP